MKKRNPVCCKCGYQLFVLVYHVNEHDCVYDDRNKVDREHLHYYCQRCHYDWTGPIAEEGKR